MSTTKTHRLQITRTFEAPREKVFRAWTDPKALKVFHAPQDSFTIPMVEVDLRVGGRYKIEMRAPDGKSHIATGIYREVVPPEKLVYTWKFEMGGKMDGTHLDMGETVVTLEFRVKGNGTELTLTHELFPNAEEKDSHLQGWTGIVERLQKYVEGK